jgi:AAA family ATP:ADP antiporter
MSTSSNPTARVSPLGRILGAVAAIERHEMPAVVAAFCLFFCVMGGYFAVRPVRDTVGTLIGRDRVADLWVATWIASLAIIPIYGFVVSRFRRGVFLPWTYGFVALALAVVGVALNDENSVFGMFFIWSMSLFNVFLDLVGLAEGRMDLSTGPFAAGQFFYVFISVLNLFIISVFWSFLLELFRTDQTKRLFGVIAAGGTAGALAGPLFTDVTVQAIGNSGVLFLGAALFSMAIVCQRVLLGLWTSGRGPQQDATAAPVRDRRIGGNWVAGVGIVLRSPYLLGIASFVVLLASVSTFLYFEQLRLVALTFTDTEERTRVFARMDWVVQSLTIVSQIFLTGRIAARRGVVMLLMMVPIAMIFGFLILAAWNTFAMLAVIFIARRFGEYAFVRPGREMLWAPLDKETKYKAKNFVDLPVYRGADALVAQLQNMVGNAGFGPQAIALMGAVTAGLWAINGWWLGRRHDAAESGPARQAEPIISPSGARTVGARP